MRENHLCHNYLPRLSYLSEVPQLASGRPLTHTWSEGPCKCIFQLPYWSAPDVQSLITRWNLFVPQASGLQVPDLDLYCCMPLVLHCGCFLAFAKIFLPEFFLPFACLVGHLIFPDSVQVLPLSWTVSWPLLILTWLTAPSLIHGGSLIIHPLQPAQY